MSMFTIFKYLGGLHMAIYLLGMRGLVYSWMPEICRNSQKLNTRSIMLVQVLSPEGAKQLRMPLDLPIFLHVKLLAVHKIV